MQAIKKLVKYAFLGLGILIAILLILNAVLVWQSGKQLEARLSKLREAGEPLSLRELGNLPAAPGADAAAVLKRVEPETKALAREMSPTLEAASKRPLTEADWKEIEKAIANHPSVVPALHEAASCPSYKSTLNYQVKSSPDFLNDLLLHVQIQREAANILKYQAQLQVRQKDFDGAMRTCLSALRLARHSEHEPLMISYLVTIAIRAVAISTASEVLQAGPVAAALHKDLEAELAKHETSRGFHESLRSERANMLQSLEDINMGGWFTRAYVNDEKCYALDQFADWVGQVDDSYAQFQSYSKSAVQNARSVRHTLSSLLIPATLKVWEADFRSRCLVRCLRVLNALTAQKDQNLPAKLIDLGLPTAAVTDPYTDKPLVVKRVHGQWLVYGLGPNLQDDGGKLDKLEDVGLGPKVEEKQEKPEDNP